MIRYISCIMLLVMVAIFVNAQKIVTITQPSSGSSGISESSLHWGASDSGITNRASLYVIGNSFFTNQLSMIDEFGAISTYLTEGGAISWGGGNGALNANGSISWANGTLNASGGGDFAETITVGGSDISLTPAGDGVFGGTVTVADDPYAAGWNGSAVVPTKNAVYDKIETLSSGHWVREVIIGGVSDGATIASGVNFGYPSSVGIPTASGHQRVQLNMSGGYLSNLVVMRTNVFAATTNIIFTIMTNTMGAADSAIKALVDSPLTITLNGSATTACTTNTTTQFVLLATTNKNYWTMKMTSSAALAAHPMTWSIEWWHQTP